MREPITALPPAKRLRPIVFGSSGPPAAAAARTVHPEVTLSVHTDDGDLLGYVVVDHVVPRRTWGGLTVAAELALDELVLLARSTTLQLRLFGIRRGSHHCLLRTVPGLTESERASRREEYLDALDPLAEAGICEIVYSVAEDSSEPLFAHQAACKSATATALAALEYLGIPAYDGTVALYRPWRLGEDVIALLCRHGLEVVAEGDEALRAQADVLIVDGPLWSVGDSEAASVRARTVVSLAPVAATRSAERELHARGVLTMPDTLSTAGRLVALELKSRGAEEAFAVERSFSLVAERVRALLGSLPPRRKSFPSFVQAAAGLRGNWLAP